MERRADELCVARVARTLYDDDIDSPGEGRRVDWGEIPVILVWCADCIDGAAQVVHGVAVKEKTTGLYLSTCDSKYY